MEYKTVEQWPMDKALEEQDKFSSALPSYLGPIFRWNAFRILESLEAEYNEKNNGSTILAAVRKCANHDLVMPEWLARAFIARYDMVLNCREGSWDKAFDPPFPKGRHLSALRKKQTLKYAVLNAVTDKLQTDPKSAIDKGLFEEVGKPLGLGATLTEEYYYAAKRTMGVPP